MFAVELTRKPALQHVGCSGFAASINVAVASAPPTGLKNDWETNQRSGSNSELINNNNNNNNFFF